MSRLLFTYKSFELLEPYEGKLSRTVLRGEGGSNAADLLDKAIAREGMAEYIKYLFKTVRKFFGEAIVVTQEVDDIIASETPVISTFSLFAQNEYTKVIPKNNVIPSYHLEVTYDKTVHLIFPSGISYIDLGSSNIIAGKAEGAENVVRVKAAVKDFTEETNFSVITEEGSFYSFIVNYSEVPEKLSIEMKDFLHEEKLSNQPENSMDVRLSELGNESPKNVQMALEKIYKTDRKKVKHVKSNQFGIEFLLRGIYSFNGLLFLNMEIKNKSEIPFDIDFLVFKIVDKKVAKRTAIQETIIKPVRAYNLLTSVNGKETDSTVFAFKKFTIPDKKQLVVELFEKNGGRHQQFVIKNGVMTKVYSVKKLL